MFLELDQLYEIMNSISKHHVVDNSLHFLVLV
jgi:hypothetical protein